MTVYRYVWGQVLALLCVGLQAGCSTHDSSSLTMDIDPTSITLGESATITWHWKSDTGGSCHAGGAWKGDRKLKGSKVVTPTETGILTYTLDCLGGSFSGEAGSASVTLTVNPASSVAQAAVQLTAAAEYAFTPIDFPGADRTEAYGINNAGQIVGLFFDASGQHGFVKDGDTYTAFDVGSDGTSAFGINDLSQVVGSDSTNGFLKDGELVEPISVPSSSFTVAWGIDDAGRVVGTFNDDIGTRGFLKDGDAFVAIDVPEALFVEARGINEGGEIVGNYISGAGVFQAFSMFAGELSAVQVPDASITAAGGINDSGQVVGSFRDSGGVAHGFVMNGSALSILDVPGAASPNFTQARGINDAGSVVGWYDEGGGRVRGFLATPASTNVADVTIDIAPGNETDVINPRSRARIWVAILSDTDPAHSFDPASQMDIATARFGPAGAESTGYRLRDVNDDGVADLVLRFRVDETGIQCGDQHATLTGETFGGQGFSASDRIRTVGCS